MLYLYVFCLGAVYAAQLDFEAAVSDVLSWRGINYPLPAKGVTAVTVGINVASEVAVDIESDLEGVAVDLSLIHISEPTRPY